MPRGLSPTLTAAASSEAVPAPENDLVRIVVFNDHPVFRSCLSWKIGPESGTRLITDAASLSETLSIAAGLPAGSLSAVVADLRIGDGNSEGVESVRTLVSSLNGIPVIVYSDQYSRSFASRITKAGAAAIVRKSEGAERLVAAVHDAVESHRTALTAGQPTRQGAA